jgi:hypothetical protein
MAPRPADPIQTDADFGAAAARTGGGLAASKPTLLQLLLVSQ